MGASQGKSQVKEAFRDGPGRYSLDYRQRLSGPYGIDYTGALHRSPYRNDLSMTRASSPCLNSPSLSRNNRTEERERQNTVQSYISKYPGSHATQKARQCDSRNKQVIKKTINSPKKYLSENISSEEDDRINDMFSDKKLSNDFEDDKTISDCINSQFENLVSGDKIHLDCDTGKSIRKFTKDVLKATSPKKNTHDTTSENKLSANDKGFPDYLRDITSNIFKSPTSSPSVKSKGSVHTLEVTRVLDKPPTPPPRIVNSKPQTPSAQVTHTPLKLKNSRYSPSVRSNYAGSLSSPKPRPQTGRSASLPRPPSAYKPTPPNNQLHQQSMINKPRRSSSISQKLDNTNTTPTEKQHCLSRIEYTFYINDNEECQKPFFDRRVEAIARASQCSVCLHKPPAGHKPVYYKGIRVLPVTISARTMVTLKRCIARLDIQYPHYNVKAFCPPDMY